MSVWEIQEACRIVCRSPNICWEPTSYTDPQICLPPGTNPNNFKNFVSLTDYSFMFVLLMVFVGGLAIGVIISALFLVVKKNCNCYFRHNSRCQRKNNRSTNSQTLAHLAGRSRQPPPVHTPLIVRLPQDVC
uniref:Uncharacterized protein n=1 Tax=Globodera rostochiensis TaxID=31243 RepID=A0A914HL50_GLORO